jgi:hypothetical protein
MDKKPCDICKKEVDFSVEASGHCMTHNKDLCWKCVHECRCVEGARCERTIFTNPAWICNLKSTLETK